MPPRDHQPVIDRFVAACQADERMVAAFLGGSYACGDADEYSDLDLGLIATDAARDELWTERRACIGLLGEPLFVEDFDREVTVFFFLADGTIEGTFVPMEPGPMLEAGLAIVACFRELAADLARRHWLKYPVQLEALMLARLDALGTTVT